mmetsp:Transcript_28326/g.82068  ORF Transcript_28326/g.82068 Transcript_28326/m.82068 type:complete len:206 (+) Transcript_28326:420-1037(+)
MASVSAATPERRGSRRCLAASRGRMGHPAGTGSELPNNMASPVLGSTIAMAFDDALTSSFVLGFTILKALLPLLRGEASDFASCWGGYHVPSAASPPASLPSPAISGGGSTDWCSTPAPWARSMDADMIGIAPSGGVTSTGTAMVFHSTTGQPPAQQAVLVVPTSTPAVMAKAAVGSWGCGCCDCGKAWAGIAVPMAIACPSIAG